VRYLQERFQASERKSCTVLRINRGWHRRQPTRDEQAFLRMRIKEIASVRKRYGYRRIHVLLLREGWKINHKRVCRLYRQEGLNLRKPSSRKKISVERAPEKGLASAVNECWCMDFVSDQLYNGKWFRALTVLDTFSRESIAIYVDKSIKGEQVCDELEKSRQPAGCLGESRSTTDLSSSPEHWMPERTSTRSSSITPVLVRRLTTRISSLSTAASGTNA